MVDTIDLQKVFPPVSSAGKVKQVKQRHATMQERKFAQHLQEKGKRGKEDGKDPPEDAEELEETPEQRRRSRAATEGSQNTSGQENLHEGTTGKLIDIVV